MASEPVGGLAAANLLNILYAQTHNLYNTMAKKTNNSHKVLKLLYIGNSGVVYGGYVVEGRQLTIIRIKNTSNCYCSTKQRKNKLHIVL